MPPSTTLIALVNSVELEMRTRLHEALRARAGPR
jgi:hypothetical protein